MFCYIMTSKLKFPIIISDSICVNGKGLPFEVRGLIQETVCFGTLRIYFCLVCGSASLRDDFPYLPNHHTSVTKDCWE